MQVKTSKLLGAQENASDQLVRAFVIVKTKVIATGDDKRGRYPEGSATTPSAGKRECVIFVYVFHNIKTKVIAMANEEMM